MKLPRTPPPIRELLTDPELGGQIAALLTNGRVPPSMLGGAYLHWEEVIRRRPPEGLTTRGWWLATKLQRVVVGKQVPLVDVAGDAFWYALVDPIPVWT